VNKGKIDLIAPARVVSVGTDRKSVVLNDGRILKADAVVLATGFQSSWNNMFDRMFTVPVKLPLLIYFIHAEVTRDDLGLGNRAPMNTAEFKNYEWNYTTLQNPPPAHPATEQRGSTLYRGLVPAKNILQRDFAVNGASVWILVTYPCTANLVKQFTTNCGYVYETSAHWISSYFLSDKFLRVPSSSEEAFLATEREAAYLRKRFPDMLLWTNESGNGVVKFFG
jgi:dimethylaniline monooxygenase (N-oxide forming)